MIARSICVAAVFGVMAAAQEGARLREAFEGRNVLLKIDMPATKDGVDIYPERSTPLEFRTYQHRIKNYGVAVRQGESIMVTKVLIKEKLIEFQLGGGGYGTFGDETGSSVSSTYQSKSKAERDVENQLKTASGDQRRSLERQLDSMRRDRERMNTLAQAEAAQVREMAKARIEQKRKEGGSRFNIRFEAGVPASAATPEGIMAALAQHVDFGVESPRPVAAVPQPAPMRGGLPILRKGMSRGEVDSMLGTPIDVTERNEGTIRVTTAVYDVSGVTGKVDFANGVLLKFVYQSR